jgi:CspA family cold shock protein
MSFLYSVSEEFIEILDEYELSDPYTQKLEETEKIGGKVTFFHDRQGYGFIQRDDSSESDDDDVFFHMEEVDGPDLEEGERVRFAVTEEGEGPRAEDLERTGAEKSDNRKDLTLE